MNKKTINRAGSEQEYGPRLAGEILHDYLENSNEPLAVAYREQSDEANEQGWHRNTDMAVDLKTLLRSDSCMKTGKDYRGILCRDKDMELDDYRCHDPHYTFIETVPPAPRKRNPHVFKGDYITVTRRDNRTLHPNFKPLKIDEDFCLEQYAIGVRNELLGALEGLIEKGEGKLRSEK